MPADLTARNIRTTDQFLELFARAVFASGLSWSVVEKRWPLTREAFDRFSCGKVAALANTDLARLGTTPGVIANDRKIVAVREAARFLMNKRSECGSIRRWLDSLAGFDEQQRALRSVPFIGPFGAYYVLAVSGYDVPVYKSWQDKYSPMSKPA